MSFERQQKRFDGVKWFDSIRAGDDRCGTYAFCGECRKDEPNPCARAMHRYQNGYVRSAVIRRHA